MDLIEKFLQLISQIWSAPPKTVPIRSKDPRPRATITDSTAGDFPPPQKRVLLSLEELREIMPKLPLDKATAYLPFIQQALEEFEINNQLRISAFMAQLAHESVQLRYMQEIWGPTPAQIKYEGRKDLGNTEPGDGYRFAGRGPIQLTGRNNYKEFGKDLGLDLVGNPELAAQPEVGFRIAGLFWKKKGLNALADAKDFLKITKKINGGTNGLADREKYYEKALEVLGKKA